MPEPEARRLWYAQLSQLQRSLLAMTPLAEKFQNLTDAIVRIFDADFSRIWLIRPGDQCEQGCLHAEVQEGPHVCQHRDRCLHLIATSGRYTHLDGPTHRRVPFGCYKIGRIASDEESGFITNDVQNDSRVHDRGWARDLGLVSFAGYRLRAPEGGTLGVLALFAKHPILEEEDAILDGLASTVALLIQRTAAEKALHDSEAKFRTLFNSTSDSVFLLNQEGFLDCNPAAPALFGCATRKDLRARHPAFFSPPLQPDGTDSLTGANQHIATALEDGSHHFEWIHQRADTGKLFSADVLLNAMELDGKPVLQAVVRDITRRKSAETELQAKTALLEAQMHASLDGILVVDEKQKRVLVNQRIIELFNVPRNVLEDEDDRALLEHVVGLAKHPERFLEKVLFLYDHPNESSRDEVEFRSGMVLDRFSGPVLGHDGKNYGRIWTFRDITERKRAEDVRDEALSRLQKIASRVPGVVFQYRLHPDGKGCVPFASDVINEVFRLSPEQVRDDASGIFARVHPDDLADFTAAFQTSARDLSLWQHEFRLKFDDGTVRTLDGNAVPEREDDGSVLWHGFVTDITERKRAEELRLTCANLERSNRELEQFAYVASHDLQEPLRMVSSFTQLLARHYQGQLDAEAHEYIAFAVDGANRMQSMINDLLAYSRVETRSKKREPTDFKAVLDQALANLRAAIEASGAVVISGPLPVVMADRSQMIHLLQNLIGNAIKFHAGKPPRVHLSAVQEGDAWVFRVRDEGIGIDPRQAERIFQIFQRLHTREEYPGTGIGLAICKRIVERHAGRIWVESQLEKGSSFCFTIPLEGARA